MGRLRRDGTKIGRGLYAQGEVEMSVRLASMLVGATIALLANDVVAQKAAPLSGTYCGTWASGNSWRMTLQQEAGNVSASITGRRPDGNPTSASGSGTISGSQLAMNISFSRMATGTFSGRISGTGISAEFARTDTAGGRRRDSASFTRC